MFVSDSSFHYTLRPGVQEHEHTSCVQTSVPAVMCTILVALYTKRFGTICCTTPHAYIFLGVLLPVFLLKKGGLVCFWKKLLTGSYAFTSPLDSLWGIYLNSLETFWKVSLLTPSAAVQPSLTL